MDVGVRHECDWQRFVGSGKRWGKRHSLYNGDAAWHPNLAAPSSCIGQHPQTVSPRVQHVLKSTKHSNYRSQSHRQWKAVTATDTINLHYATGCAGRQDVKQHKP